MKVCINPTCVFLKTPQEEVNFGKDKRTKSGLQSRCRDCTRIQKREAYNNKSPDDRRRYALAKYKISLETYNSILSQQEYKCKICKSNHPGNRWGKNIFYVDHDHGTGVVRGLLCLRCNAGLGYFKDDKELLESASKYLSGE